MQRKHCTKAACYIRTCSFCLCLLLYSLSKAYKIPTCSFFLSRLYRSISDLDRVVELVPKHSRMSDLPSQPVRAPGYVIYSLRDFRRAANRLRIQSVQPQMALHLDDPVRLLQNDKSESEKSSKMSHRSRKEFVSSMKAKAEPLSGKTKIPYPQPLRSYRLGAEKQFASLTSSRQ